MRRLVEFEMLVEQVCHELVLVALVGHAADHAVLE